MCRFSANVWRGPRRRCRKNRRSPRPRPGRGAPGLVPERGGADCRRRTGDHGSHRSGGQSGRGEGESESGRRSRRGHRERATCRPGTCGGMWLRAREWSALGLAPYKLSGARQLPQIFVAPVRRALGALAVALEPFGYLRVAGQPDQYPWREGTQSSYSSSPNPGATPYYHGHSRRCPRSFIRASLSTTCSSTKR